MQERRLGCKPRRECRRHEEVACVRDKRQHGDLEIGRLCRNHGKARILTRRGDVDRACYEALPRGQPRCLGENPQRERHHEIPERNRHTVVHTLYEHRAPRCAELFFDHTNHLTNMIFLL